MLSEAIEELKAAVDTLVAADASTLADDESIVALHQQLARLDAVNARAAAAFDANRSWQASGARTAAAWLTWKLRLPGPTAKRRVRLGRALRHLPAVESAWLAGDITDAHVATIARARTDTTAAAMARDEAQLVGHAKTLRFSQFDRVVAYWAQHADPDGAERSAERLHAERAAYLSTTFQGTKNLDATFDPVSGAVFERELTRLERQLFDADWADANQRLGREPAVGELRRTPAQRRHDALVEMAARSASMPKGARRPAPLFTVFVGWETLQGRICELANGTVITPGSLVPYLTAADFERVVFDSPSRVIDVGVRRRLFEGATRRAVEVRDRECFHDTCEERDDLQIDHIQPYAWGGPTIEANGRAACAGHNRRRRSRPPQTTTTTKALTAPAPPCYRCRKRRTRVISGRMRRASVAAVGGSGRVEEQGRCLLLAPTERGVNSPIANWATCLGASRYGNRRRPARVIFPRARH